MSSDSKRKYNQDNHFFMKKSVLCAKLDVKENVLNNSITRLRKLGIIVSTKNFDLTPEFYQALSEYFSSATNEITRFEFLHNRKEIANHLTSIRSNSNSIKDENLSPDELFQREIDEIFSSAIQQQLIRK